jgi:hypothetical protein
MRLTPIGSGLAIVVAAALGARLPGGDTAVHLVRPPEGSLVPDVVMDAKGRLHMVYGLGDHAWYVSSIDDGRTFGPPVRVNSEGAVQLTMGERGPKLAVGTDGSIHVAWVDRWSPGAKVLVRYSRSIDGGKSFEPAKRISSMPGVDGATMTADGEGNVLVFWHVFDPPQEEVPNGHWMYLSRSTDNGASFAPGERVRIADGRDLACSMCMMRARTAADGNVYLAFRSAENNIRDFYVLRSRKAENRFTALRVNEDRWELRTCPMCGPELTLDADGRAFCSFMTRHSVYWATLAPGGAGFALHVATPSGEGDEIYPSAVANRRGEAIFLWQVGPMSVSGRATVKWAIYTIDGAFTGRQGTAGVSTSGTKATAFVGADGDFHIVTTAKELQDGAAEIRVDGGRTHQTYEGFGATTLSLIRPGPGGDSLGPELRKRAIDALYGQVRLTMGNVAVGPHEGPGGQPGRNDDGDPHAIRWEGFDLFQAEALWPGLVQPGASLGLDDYSLEGKINWRWSSPWLGELHRTDRDRCLEECAEQVEACAASWKKIAGSAPRLIHLFNEPTTGNREIEGADAAMVRDIVKRCGDRLGTAGFPDVKFVVPNEETVRRSIDVARAILEDPGARKYVAAAGYHVYPYGSPYASVPRILHASGAGRPDPGAIEERRELRELCRKYGLPAWMTEVSHAEVDPRSLDHLRGRAIHIHDEMVYADAAAFYGMNAVWDRKTHAAHFAGRGGEDPASLFTEEDTIVLVENESRTVLITGMGHAIGHYARWLKRGAVRVEAASADPLVLVTAFRDGASRRLVLVLVNDAAEGRELSVSLSGLRVKGPIVGEESREQVRWGALPPFEPASPDRIRLRIPALSVTTVAAPLDGVQD